MTRKQKIERVKVLKAQGLSLREIGNQLGVDKSTAWKWLNPERVKEKARLDNAKRAVAKRQWERDHRTPCPRCREPMASGSQCPSKTPLRCASCYHDDQREQAAVKHRQVEAMWLAGMSMPQIQSVMGWSRGHLGVEMDRMRGRGYNLPYRYAGKRNGTKFKHLAKAAA